MADATHLRPAAEACLGVDAATPAAAAFLRRVGEADFMPAAELIEAAAALGVVPRDGDEFPALEAYAERMFAERLDEFLAAYWATGPDARREEWAALFRLGGHVPRQRFRLGELQAGLGLTMPEDEGERFDPVLRVLETAYLAPAARRAAELAAVWRKAGVPAVELRRRAAEFAARRPVFALPLRVAGATGEEMSLLSHAVFRDEERKVVVRRRPAASVQADSGKAHGVVGIVIAVVAVGVLKILISGSAGNSRPVAYPTPAFTPPAMPKWDPPPPPPIDFDKFGVANQRFGGFEKGKDPFNDLPPGAGDPLEQFRRQQREMDEMLKRHAQDPFRPPRPFDPVLIPGFDPPLPPGPKP